MRYLFCPPALLLASPAQANGYALAAPGFDFPYSTSPVNLAFELRTAADDVVRWEWNGIADPMTAAFPNAARFRRVPESEALANGIDWAAWQAALPDHAFNRILITYNGVTQEQVFPWVLHQGTSWRDGFDLDEMAASIRFPTIPRPPNSTVSVSFEGINIFEAPEPATWLLLLVGFCLHFGIRRRKSTL